MEKHLETLQGLNTINCFWLPDDGDILIKALFLLRQVLGKQTKEIEIEALFISHDDWDWANDTLRMIFDK